MIPPWIESRACYARRMELLVISRFMAEGFECFIPAVDDNRTDFVAKTSSGRFIELQVKARKGEVGKKGIGRLEVKNPEIRPNYYYLFYAEIPDIMWLFSAQQYLEACSRHKSGKHMNKTWIVLLNDSGTPVAKYNDFKVQREDFKEIFK